MSIRINLLPTYKKQDIRQKKNFRLLIWQSWLLIILTVFCGGMLLGVRWVVGTQVKESERLVDVDAPQSFYRDLDEAQSVFRETDRKVALLKNIQKEHVYWSGPLRELGNMVPEGIQLNGLLAKDYSLSLSGLADKRDTLIGFKEALNRSECFVNASLPLDDILSQENIPFQLDIGVKKECLKPGNL